MFDSIGFIGAGRVAHIMLGGWQKGLPRLGRQGSIEFGAGQDQAQGGSFAQHAVEVDGSTVGFGEAPSHVNTAMIPIHVRPRQGANPVPRRIDIAQQGDSGPDENRRRILSNRHGLSSPPASQLDTHGVPDCTT